MIAEPRFNLLDEPWLPCRRLDGTAEPLGIRQALLRAPQLAGVWDPAPITTVALLRLLVAVLHAAYGRPWRNTDRARLWEQRQWDEDRVNGYLDQWRERFWLIHPEYPFYQDAGFELVRGPATVARLAVELASGNNDTLFDYTLDDAPPALGLGECARLIVRYQSFGLPGLDRSTSNKYGPSPNYYRSPAADGANLLLLGSSLFETALLNMVVWDERQPYAQPDGDDRPVWEWSHLPARTVVPPPGYLAYLTWPARYLALGQEDKTLDGGVRHVHVQQGPYFGAGLIRDPFFGLRVDSRGKVVPIKLSASRALWRDSASLFGFSLDASPKGKKAVQVQVVPRPRVMTDAEGLQSELGRPLPLSCMVAGCEPAESGAGDVNMWRLELLPVPAAILADLDAVEALNGAVAQAERIGRCLWNALRHLASALMSPEDPGKIEKSRKRREERDRLANSWGVEEEYWPALEQPFRELLRQFGSDRNDALSRWKRKAITAANTAFDHAERQAGRGARELRARVAGRLLYWNMTHEWQGLLRPTPQSDEEGTPK